MSIKLHGGSALHLRGCLKNYASLKVAEKRLEVVFTTATSALPPRKTGTANGDNESYIMVV